MKTLHDTQYSTTMTNCLLLNIRPICQQTRNYEQR